MIFSLHVMSTLTTFEQWSAWLYRCGFSRKKSIKYSVYKWNICQAFVNAHCFSILNSLLNFVKIRFLFNTRRGGWSNIGPFFKWCISNYSRMNHSTEISYINFIPLNQLRKSPQKFRVILRKIVITICRKIIFWLATWWGIKVYCILGRIWVL